jgi:murein DD-endopeptidase MepM/ murein hydrolase activator NlpD
MRAVLVMVAAAVLAGAFVAAASRVPSARADGSAQLQKRIARGRARVGSLSGAVAADSRRVRQLSGAVAATTAQLDGLQHDLTAKLSQLYRLRAELDAAQIRLARLQATEAADERVLAAQLVGTYEGGQPNIIDVVLESRGFNDLLDRLQFVERVGRQDARIAAGVKAARRALAAEAVRLGALSARRQQVAEQILSERNSVGRAKVSLVSQELAAARARSSHAGQLAGARVQVASLTTQLSRLQAAERAAAQRAAAQRAATQRAAQSPPSVSSPPSGGSGRPSAPAPAAPVSGGFEFPMPKADVSPPATWSLDDGVDISAPGGTPELAVCSGTIVLHGIGGFGPSAPVLHCDQPLSGYDYVYYGHAGPGNWTPIGTHVAQGQVISQVGYGIVGISSGPHLEVGFADSSGAPVGPSSAPAMMALLRASY